ncbi:MAG TPA: hypothetical protein VL326_32195 [Kofleriaceae bacterium]|nr:hypothetical protein [Kofleriaceae bacterium]
MRIGGLLVLVSTASLASLAHADTPMNAATSGELYDRLWPRAPQTHQLQLSDQITQQLTELGNFMGEHMNVLSHDMFTMTFDGKRRHAFFAVGGGDAHYLEFKVASDVQFLDGRATINARIDLSVAGNSFQLELPEMEMVPASYHGERGVEVRVPLFKRSF